MSRQNKYAFEEITGNKSKNMKLKQVVIVSIILEVQQILFTKILLDNILKILFKIKIIKKTCCQYNNSLK